ncbi:2OG-Fe(II) oxygenase family protein [Gimibacter soli]|uniref:2OG-Fe(II) oxygenase n=1 Tax=Gimibacter soli TaxID=3024400 RepID=A0AAE9XMB0_9PROT|nr:2OG-Fe(II) oxygenase [Gimibacter soli]WCL53528.1 2OG-Fe(II) oxygenase [Gimibacter soli]
MAVFKNLQVGDPAPWFHQRSYDQEKYHFDSVAGRYMVLCFFATAADSRSKAALEHVYAMGDIFNDRHAAFFGVSNDPTDETNGRVANRMPGYRFFWDFDFKISKLYAACAADESDPRASFARRWVILDPTLRVISIIQFEKDGSDLVTLTNLLRALPPVDMFAGMELQAPVILLPNVFSHELCDRLVSLYDMHGGRESGVMREINGRTVGVREDDFKRRSDYHIEDKELQKELRTRIRRTVVPEIAKVHQFTVTRMERFIVACYKAEDGGHFSAHRDNTTAGTAHRRFATSINLNDDFEGGELRFPEYGSRSFRIPKGAAVVFSCSLLHKVNPVTKGRRYAFLPFLYDDAAAAIREKNAGTIDYLPVKLA